MQVVLFLLKLINSHRGEDIYRKVNQIDGRCDHDMLKSKRVRTCFRKVKDLQSNMITVEVKYK